MTGKERMLTALAKGKPDRLPATIHQWQPYHLKAYMNGMNDIEAFKAVGLDAAITWFDVTEPVCADWAVSISSHQTGGGAETLYEITTPRGMLTTRTGSNEMTTWVTEHIVKHKEDIYLLRDYMPVPLLNRQGAILKREALGDGGILRTFIPYKQGGCWQDACELYGAERLIMECYDDPDWVHEFLGILLEKKLQYVSQSLAGMPFDLIETGGGAASNTLISPAIHEQFCLPYDRKVHDAIHCIGFPVVYHTCGGMSRITHLIVQNHCDVSETLSPAAIGGDISSDVVACKVFTDLFPRVALIGGFDQVNLLEKGSTKDIENEVGRLFKLYGKNGGYICSAADHFFHAPVENLRAFAQAARNYIY